MDQRRVVGLVQRLQHTAARAFLQLSRGYTVQAAKLGQPLAKAAKNSKLAQALNQLLTLTVESAESDDGEETAKDSSSLFSKLGLGALGKKKDSKVALNK